MQPARQGNLAEISFEDLEREPIEQLRTVYAQLQLPAFEDVERAAVAYVAALAGYRKNSYSPLEPALQSRIAQRWGRWFDAWGYPTTGARRLEAARDG